MHQQSTTKPPAVDYFKVPRRLWRLMKKHLPPEPVPDRQGGRRRIGNRAVSNGIWYVLWTGCQWKAVHRDWFGASSSVLHERFQTWQAQGVWDRVFETLAKFYRRERHSQWQWQAVDSRSVAAPLGGAATGQNPTDRARLGSKPHLLVNQRGAPLAIHISGANQHDKWSVAQLVFQVAVKRPPREQHFCADKGYDYADVFDVVKNGSECPQIIVRKSPERRPKRPLLSGRRLRSIANPATSQVGTYAGPSAGPRLRVGPIVAHHTQVFVLQVMTVEVHRVDHAYLFHGLARVVIPVGPRWYI
jgi:putative transposase